MEETINKSQEGLRIGFFRSLKRNLVRVFKGKSNLSLIHDKTRALNKELFSRMSIVGEHLDELSAIVNSQNLTAKYAKLAELENDFILMKSKIDQIKLEMEEIIELQRMHRYTVIIDDQEYLDDKTNNLEEINYYIEEIIQLLSQRPSSADIRNEFLDFLSKRVNIIINDINNIIIDDRQLDSIYSDLTKL